jgi:hypothetical protein
VKSNENKTKAKSRPRVRGGRTQCHQFKVCHPGLDPGSIVNFYEMLDSGSEAGMTMFVKLMTGRTSIGLAFIEKGGRHEFER